MEAEWQCEACTTFNAGTEIACTVCFTTRMSAKDVAVTWEWQADNVWIPYDLPTCIQVEDAFKQKLDRVGLSSGFFATQKNTYEIHFQWEGRPVPAAKKAGRRLLGGMLKGSGGDEGKAEPNAKCLSMTQINIHSHNPRQVRRIDTNDDSIFVAVDKVAVLTAMDKCGVCQEMFIEEEDSDEELPQALSTPVNKTEGKTALTSSTQQQAPLPSHSPASHTPSLTKTSSAPPSSTKLSSSSSVHVPTKTRSTSSANSKSSSSGALSSSTSSSSSSSAALVVNARTPPKMCEQDVVHLAKCRNHYFHRDCISQWVKLKHTCPFCKTPI